MDIDGILRQVNEAAPAPAEMEPSPRALTEGKPMRRTTGSGPRQWLLPGFGPLTRITTALGEVPAQALRERDMVRTREGNFKPIVWIDRIVVDEEFLSLHPDALPVMIKPNALGRGLPNQPIFLAPRQELMPRSDWAGGERVNAVDLMGKPGIYRKAESSYTYTLFHLGEPAIVQAGKVFVPVDP